jgi:hypothetical protein
MPALPESLGVDPLLAALLHVTAFLDFADDDVVEPDAANEALEQVETYIRRLPAARVEEIQAQLDKIEEHAEQAGWPEDMIDFARDFLYNCGLGDEDDGDDDD